MSTASLENSKRLYELSRWNDEDSPLVRFDDKDPESTAPAYDAGYLLRKLPGTELYDATNCWQAENTSLQNWRTVQDTPEDALCLLAIKLFEEGVL